ncbi:MAG: hypothetical protein ABEJ98_06050 [Candidatus Nanohaloarchaea archaeon]
MRETNLKETSLKAIEELGEELVLNEDNVELRYLGQEKYESDQWNWYNEFEVNKGDFSLTLLEEKEGPITNQLLKEESESMASEYDINFEGELKQYTVPEGSTKNGYPINREIMFEVKEGEINPSK